MVAPKDAGLSRRIRREPKTVRAMIELFCQAHHDVEGGSLCPECRDLWDYARQRVERCPFGLDKPTCLNCTVHCFKPRRKEQVREVMRFAGPRMTWRHPVLAALHLIDRRREPPAKGGGGHKPPCEMPS